MFDMRLLKLTIIIISCFMVIGCRPLHKTLLPEDPEGRSIYSFGGDRVTSAGANQLLDEKLESITIEELVIILDPEVCDSNGKDSNGGERPSFCSNSSDTGVHSFGSRQGKPGKSAEEVLELEKELQKALQKANENEEGGCSNLARIQDYFITVSNQRCNLYSTYLTRFSSLTDGIFGSMSVVFGGAGAMFQSESATRILSGLAGISSGISGEINHAVFKGQFAELILDNVKEARKDKLEEIMAKRKTCYSEGGVRQLARDTRQLAEDAKKDAKKLAEKTEKLAKNAEKLAKNAEKLAEDTKQLAEDTKQLAEDTKQLAEDAKQLAEDAKKDTKQLAEGTKKLAEDAKKLAEDVKKDAEQLAEKTGNLAKNAEKLEKEDTKKLAEDTKQLAEGTKKLVKKAEKLEGDTKKLAESARQLADKAQELLTKDVEPLVQRTKSLAQGTLTKDNTKKLAESTERLAKKAEKLARDTGQPYMVSEALVDAINYHGICSIGSGLAKMKEQLEKAKNPSLDVFKERVKEFNEIRELLNSTGTKVSKQGSN